MKKLIAIPKISKEKKTLFGVIILDLASVAGAVYIFQDMFPISLTMTASILTVVFILPSLITITSHYPNHSKPLLVFAIGKALILGLAYWIQTQWSQPWLLIVTTYLTIFGLAYISVLGEYSNNSSSE